MTEHQIEIIAERMQDRLDKRFMQSDMRAAQYEHESREIAEWVERAHKQTRETNLLLAWHDCLIPNID